MFIILPSLIFVLVRRMCRIWCANEVARHRFWQRGRLGYNLLHRVDNLRNEWTWDPKVVNPSVSGGMYRATEL
jgi:hypothetical protein